MSFWSLIRSSLVFHRQSLLGVALGAAVCTAVLTGALIVGDSVHGSLNALALDRLGKTETALELHNRFFRTGLADSLSAELGSTAVPALVLNGTVGDPDGGGGRCRVKVLGVDDRFRLLNAGTGAICDAGEIAVSLNLAARLALEAGDEVVLRIEKPQALPREAPLSLDRDMSAARRLRVHGPVPDGELGRFSLAANQAAPFNVFVSLAELGRWAGIEGQANLLLVMGDRPGSATPGKARAALQRAVRLADLGFELRDVPGSSQRELVSNRIFLDREIARAAASAGHEAVGVLTYFATRISLGARETPYSFVAAMGPLVPGEGSGPSFPGRIESGGIVINQWLADDLEAREGDELEVAYLAASEGRTMEERRTRFRIASIVPLEGAAADRTLMPSFPGLSEGEKCSDWDPGIDIDLSQIRPRDEDYWARHRGTPKAFISLETGQALWANRFGSLTAVRYPASAGPAEQIEERIKKALDFPSLGFFFRPVRQEALAAVDLSLDLGPYFLGMSFVLFAAALILMGLFFSLAVEQRGRETGTLLALGFTSSQAGRIVLCEGIAAAAAGSLPGLLLGLGYSWALIAGLGTLWSDAVAGAAIDLHVEGSSLLLGSASALAMAVPIIWFTHGRQARRPIPSLLAGARELQSPRARATSSRTGFLVAAASILGAAGVLLLAAPGKEGHGSGAGAFFGAGALLLVGTVALVHGLLGRQASAADRRTFTLPALAACNRARNGGRSLAVVAVLACGTFLVFAVGSNRTNLAVNPGDHSSGTGGFSLIGETSLPVLHGPETPKGRLELGLDEKAVRGVDVVKLRLREGDDASCLNLNRAQHPPLLGVDPEALQDGERFTFLHGIENSGPSMGWSLLDVDCPEGVVPAVADQATIVWGLERKVGDTIDYRDEKGRPFKVKLVGSLKNSIFQGSLLISERDFRERFPSEEGYRLFLIDPSGGRQEEIEAAWQKAGRSRGLEVTRAAGRLAAFCAVENCYLSLFQVLGGLGLLLGGAGLGVVLLRNVMERQSELGLLHAVGFSDSSLARLLFLEHGRLFAAGIACGVAAACVAVWPVLRSLGKEVPWISLGITVAVIAAGGFISLWAAARRSAAKDLVRALTDR